MAEHGRDAQIVPANGFPLTARAQAPLGYPELVPEMPEDSELPLAELLRVVLRRKVAVLACLVLVFGATLLYTLTRPRVYQAVATFLVDDSRGAVDASLQDQLPRMAAAISAPALETHAALLQGSATAQATAKWLEKHDGPRLNAAAIRAAVSTSIVPKTQLVQLKARARSPREAEQIANATAASYVDMNQRLAQTSSESASKYLTDQLAIARDNLARAEGALRAFKESTGTVADDAEAAKLLERAGMIRADADRSAADLAQAQKRLQNLRVQLTQQNSRIRTSEVRDNAMVQQLRERLVELEGQRLAAQAHYTKDFTVPTKVLDDQIRVVKGQLQREIRNIVGSGGGPADLAMQQALSAQLSQAEVDVASLTARAARLQADLQEADRQLKRVPARQITLAGLTRQVGVAQNIYSDLLKRSQEVEVGRVMALGNAALVEPAEAPLLPISPRVPLDLALGLIVGLGLGIAVALLIEQFDDALHQEEEVQRLAEAPVIGAVPAFEQADLAAMTARKRSQRRAIEAYTGLRYSLGFMTPGEGGHTVLVTSPDPQEGKTTTAVNLAIAAALSGRRTIVVDADLRRPSVNKLLGLDGVRGLTDYLSGQADLVDILQTFGELDLKVIPSGGHAPNPMNLLDSTRMRELVERLRQQADLIVFDSAPVLSAADSLVLAGMSDAVIAVCVPGASHRKALRRSRTMLNNIGRTFSGVVFNKIPQHSGYGYYGYYYGSYGDGQKRSDGDALEGART